jgi:chitinase
MRNDSTNTHHSKDITTCQQKGKTILLSIGGATYSEGGFKSEADAKDGAKLMWDTFGPQKDGSKSLRPFGAAILDGFDFDFEANVQNMAPFANELRSLMDADQSKQRFYLTAAPQCPYPDAADKEILNGPVYIDAIWVQFYNNFCGVNNFNTDMSSNKYNFEEWDNWAKTVSKNKNVKVLVGVPADTTAASTGYIPSSKLDNVIEYSKKFESFGGIMMWDATQAYGNDGFINDVRKSLGGADDSGSSPDPASSSAPPPPPATSTDSATKTSSSSSVPDSSPSSSSSSSASASPKGPDTTTPAQPTTDAKPTTTDAKPTTTDAKPTTTDANPTTTAAPPTADPAKPSTTQAPAPTTSAAPQDDNSDDDDSQDEGQNDEGSLSSILGTDLMGLLGGLRRANGLAGGITDGLTKGLRRPQRSRV